MQKKIFIVCLLFATILNAQTGKSQKEHFLTLKIEFFQIKEAANYGLVFNGLNLVVDYDLVIINENTIFQYSPEFGFGANFNNGIGLSWEFKPIDLYYGFQIFEESNYDFFVGPYASINYQFQLYPELQSGHNYWFSFVDLGPKIIAKVNLLDIPLRVSFSNSIAGLGSRPKVNPQSESHFYSLNFFDWLSDMNSNFEFGSFNLLNHSNLEIEFISILKDGLSIEYEFEYYGYFNNPKLDYISHGINLRWNL